MTFNQKLMFTITAAFSNKMFIHLNNWLADLIVENSTLNESLNTPRQKSIRALEIVLAIFLCFECQFLSFYACYKEYKA